MYGKQAHRSVIFYRMQQGKAGRKRGRQGGEGRGAGSQVRKHKRVGRQEVLRTSIQASMQLCTGRQASQKAGGMRPGTDMRVVRQENKSASSQAG
jgi:hypothetical protein